jgi:D-glycero-alpha-D-manno-heptose-7-phosphate kinase
MSFSGGGSDIPAFYKEFGGAVLSTTIDKYVFVTTNRKFDNRIRVSYSRTEEVDHAKQVQHSLVRAALDILGIEGGVEITTIADIPSGGTGLGSSSSFTVALLHALHAFQGRHATKSQLAETACRIEIDICREPIGKQDQYAAAFGGLNLIEFHPDDSVSVAPIICQGRTVRRLQQSLLMLYTGTTRSASAILLEQSAATQSSSSNHSALRRMVDLCYQMRDELQKDNVDGFGEALHEGWILKKSLARAISNPAIDEWYDTARRHGATGGKILGAGGGGFLLVAAPQERHSAICHALPDLRRIPFDFERMGSQIIFYQPAEVAT